MGKQYRNVYRRPDGVLAGEVTRDGAHWIRFAGREDLLWIELAIGRGPAAAQAIWDRQDGYGEPGYTPPQGFDWSGIRDSSEHAVARMLAVASEFVSREEFLVTFGVNQ